MRFLFSFQLDNLYFGIWMFCLVFLFAVLPLSPTQMFLYLLGPVVPFTEGPQDATRWRHFPLWWCWNKMTVGSQGKMVLVGVSFIFSTIYGRSLSLLLGFYLFFNHAFKHSCVSHRFALYMKGALQMISPCLVTLVVLCTGDEEERDGIGLWEEGRHTTVQWIQTSLETKTQSKLSYLFGDSIWKLCFIWAGFCSCTPAIFFTLLI